MKRSRGFSMIEMMFALILISSLAVISEQLFTLVSRLLVDAPAKQDAIIRYESAVKTLRADAWAAHSSVSDGGNVIRIDRGGGEIVRWSIEENGDAVRTSGDQIRRWAGGFGKASLLAEGPCIVVRSETSGDMRLVSQIQLADAGRRGT